MSEWKYKHPKQGSCIEGCPKYGLCHCGCNKASRLASTTEAKTNRKRNKPNTFLLNHNHKMRIPTCHPDRRHHARGLCNGCYNQLPVAKDSRSLRKDPSKYSRKLTPERMEWERKRYNRFSSLLWKHGYENIRVVLKELDREVPEEEVA